MVRKKLLMLNEKLLASFPLGELVGHIGYLKTRVNIGAQVKDRKFYRVVGTKHDRISYPFDHRVKLLIVVFSFSISVSELI